MHFGTHAFCCDTHGKIGQGRALNGELIVALSENGPEILPDHYEQSMNRSVSLSIDSNLMKQNPQALLLNILSCLPAGTAKTSLRWWIPALYSAMADGTFQWFHPPLLLYPRRDYWSRIEGKIPTLQSSLCSPSSSPLCNSMAG